MTAADRHRDTFGPVYDDVVLAVDWVRAHHHACGEHAAVHDGDDTATCGLCTRTVLLREDPPAEAACSCLLEPVS